MPGDCRRRRIWSDDEKRRIVAESHEAGASVSAVARRHDVNANLVFTWRRDSRFNGAQSGPCLLPVEVAADIVMASPDAGGGLENAERPATTAAESGRLAPTGVEIDLGNGLRLRFTEAIAEATLLRIVTSLRRAA